MTTARRGTPICDSYRWSGFAHALGVEVWTLLTPAGRRLRFCSLFPCLVAYLTNVPFEDLPIRALGHARELTATGVG